MRAFLATVEEGSLSAGARALGLAQPTLGRQVAGLENALGVLLFERTGKTLVLTASGLELLEHVRAMADAATRISITASGQSQAVEGTVRVTASDAISAYILPGVVARLRKTAPGIEIDVVASDAVQNLNRRDADIAIRHVRPDHPDLIARLLRETTGHLYASTDYLRSIGYPSTPADLAHASFVGFESSDLLITALAERGVPVDQTNFKVFSDSGVTVWEMVKQGLGISVMIRDIAEISPGIECVLPDMEPFAIPIWLAAHRELHTSRRIRIVYDALAQALSGNPGSR